MRHRLLPIVVALPLAIKPAAAIPLLGCFDYFG